MKKNYFEPTIELIKFEFENILSSSMESDPGEQGGEATLPEGLDDDN